MRSKGRVAVAALCVAVVLLAAIAPVGGGPTPAVLVVVATLPAPLVAALRANGDVTGPVAKLVVAHVPARAPPLA